MMEQGLGRHQDRFSSSKSNSHVALKPLLNGCLAGFLYNSFSFATLLLAKHSLRYSSHLDILDSIYPGQMKFLKNIKIPTKKGIGLILLRGTVDGLATFGVYDMLTKKLATGKQQQQLSLYQEVVCGLISGSTVAGMRPPWLIAVIHSQQDSSKSLFSNFFHIVKNEGAFAMWKGWGLNFALRTTRAMGMLASYKHSLNYLTDYSEGPPKWQAQMSASIISGFFAAACSHPCIYIKAVKEVVQKQYRAGDEHAYARIPQHISSILKPYGGHRCYMSFLSRFKQLAVPCMVQWWIYESVTALNP